MFSLEGDLGSDWKWNAYAQIGRTHMYQTTLSNIIPANLNRAIDAVSAPAGNLLGVPAGTIVCRSSLTDPTNGCVPLNIFGTGVASEAAIRYVNVKPGQNYQDQKFQQDVYAATLQGTLPFGLAAGPIAAAVGIEYRREKGVTLTDPGAPDRAYALGNFSPFEGRYHVAEGFAEFDVPLLRDQGVESLSFNAAGRLTNYSTSGTVVTWKFGLTSQVNQSIRLRGTVSRDIRAPSLSDLFTAGVATTGSAIDPNTGQNVFIYTYRTGNPNLKPEKAITYSAGLVLTPSFIPRLNISVDYYNINLSDAIGSVATSTILSRCADGESNFCDLLVFDGPGGALSQINRYPLNVGKQKASGFDFQADYSVPVAGGDLNLRLLGNYILNQEQNQLGSVVKYAGAIGDDNPVSGIPRARAQFSATYARGKVSVTAQTRFIGAAKLVYDWTSKDVDRNKIPAIAYVDARASFDMNDNLQLFATIDNLLNQDPPLSPRIATGSYSYYYTPVRGDIYDTIGRQYRVGVRMKF